MLVFIRNWLRQKRAEKKSAHLLYQACCASARAAAFYRNDPAADSSVPDSVQGRFEMLSVHLWLVLRHLRRLGETGLATKLIAVFFSDMDSALRESGVGDMAVPRRMKTIAQAFYGRLEAYDRAIQDSEHSEQSALKKLIIRNIAPDISPRGAARLLVYLLASNAALAEAPPADFYLASGLFAKHLLSME